MFVFRASRNSLNREKWLLGKLYLWQLTRVKIGMGVSEIAKRLGVDASEVRDWISGNLGGVANYTDKLARIVESEPAAGHFAVQAAELAARSAVEYSIVDRPVGDLKFQRFARCASRLANRLRSAKNQEQFRGSCEAFVAESNNIVTSL